MSTNNYHLIMKKVSNLNLASTLVATTIISNWLFRSLVNDLIKGLMGTESGLSFLLGFGGLLISLIGIVLGVLSSKWYFSKKNYAIEDANKVIRLAAILFAVITFILNLIGNLLLSSVLYLQLDIFSIIISVLIATAVFYISSKIMIKNTEAGMSNEMPQDNIGQPKI